jgi:hypothetical protein
LKILYNINDKKQNNKTEGDPMDANAIHHIGPVFIWLVITVLFVVTSLLGLGFLWAFDLLALKSKKQ